MNEAKYMHRDLKLANILLHFPDFDLINMTKEEKETFLRRVNFKKVRFILIISDLGFAKQVQSQ